MHADAYPSCEWVDRVVGDYIVAVDYLSHEPHALFPSKIFAFASD